MKAKDIKYTITLNIGGLEKTLRGTIPKEFFDKGDELASQTEEEVQELIEKCMHLDIKSLLRLF